MSADADRTENWSVDEAPYPPHYVKMLYAICGLQYIVQQKSTDERCAFSISFQAISKCGKPEATAVCVLMSALAKTRRKPVA